MPDVYLTTQDVQNKYKVSRATVDKWRKKGMPSTKIGNVIRYEAELLEQWVKDQNNNK